MATKIACCVVDGSSWSLLVASLGCGKATDTVVPNPQRRKKSKTTNSLLEGEENNHDAKVEETFKIIEIVQQPAEQQKVKASQIVQQPAEQQKVKASQIVGSLDDRRSKNKNRVALHVTRGWQPVWLGRSRTNVKQPGCDLYTC